MNKWKRRDIKEGYRHMTTVYLVRHMETEGNLKQIFQGHCDTPASPMGRRQMQWLEERFKSVHYDCVYSSPLRRAVETAKSIISYRQKPLVLKDELIEIDFGELEGKTLEEISADTPEVYEKLMKERNSFVPPGGESVKEVYERMRKVMDQIVTENSGKTLLVVSHGMALQCYICYLMGHDVTRIGEVPIGQNTAVTLVVYDDTMKPKITYCNDNTHIPPAHRLGNTL